VLSVYAVKLNSDPENPAEVATLDDAKIEKLKGILNDMASISHSLKTETKERTVIDDKGNETTEEVSVTTLTITFTQKSADEMATQYGFSDKQKEQLHELLSPEYSDLWAALLGGYQAGAGEILIGDASHVPKDIFNWPMADNFPISSTFGYRKDPFTGETKYHGGIDISAPEGTPILAAADGVVVVADSSDSWGGGWGYHVKIKHSDTYSTLYAHASKIAVRNGQEVKKGEVIAYVGTTGRSTGAHLHFEVYKDGARVNPLSFFG
jgi:murein DD-endopeptidase MepM/ murein hydrolase activator NlpD